MITHRVDGRDARENASRLPVTLRETEPCSRPTAPTHGGRHPAARTLAPGQDLDRQGDRCGSVYLLLDGWAFQHQVLPDGRRQILDFLLPGALLGLCDQGAAAHGVEALTRCSVAVLSRAAILERLRTDPAAALDLLQDASKCEARAFDHLTSLGRRSARERIAALIVELCSRLSAFTDGKTSQPIAIPLKQAHIADALGLTNEHVCRTLKALRKDRVMSLQDGRLLVADLARLAAEAGIEADVPDERSGARAIEWPGRRPHACHAAADACGLKACAPCHEASLEPRAG